MLEDIKFDLQTLDYRALGRAEWAELKGRLERRRADRGQSVRVATNDGWSGVRRLAAVVHKRISQWIERLSINLPRRWRGYVVASRRRRTMTELRSFNDRRLKPIGLCRWEMQSAAYRHDPSSFR
jgi:hypothetical protein